MALKVASSQGSVHSTRQSPVVGQLGDGRKADKVARAHRGVVVVLSLTAPSTCMGPGSGELLTLGKRRKRGEYGRGRT